MKYSIKITPTAGLNKMPRYTVMVEELSPLSTSSLVDLDDKLVSKLNAYLFEKDIEIDEELFDKVDETILFNQNSCKCEVCGK
jgi:hypothetical protein